MDDVRFAWPGRGGFALAIPDFAVSKSERVLLIGPSGSGKSTFLSLLCGIVSPQVGRIEVLGTDIASLSGPARDRFRAEHFGIIFQMFNLLPYGTVLDNVILPLVFAASRRGRAGAAQAAALRLLDRLGLGPEFATRSPTNELIVADEPTSALDRNRQMAFLDVLFAQVADAGSTLIMVSHDQSLAPRFDRVVPLGEIAQEVSA
jgi:putative ABC transport system ATP-binding protein